MLDGVRVLSLAHFLQGPSASQMLGDLGADVVKIESLDGAFERHWSAPDLYLEGESVFFLVANRNQRSVCVNLRHPEGKDILWRLVETADVLIDSFRPGALERLGFGWDALRERNPRLVYASLSGYGPTGPYRDKPGQDVLIQALSGLTRLNGAADDPPTPAGASLVDQHAAVLAAFGIVAALHGRIRTGQGCRVDSSLLAAALDLQIEPLGYHLNGATAERSSSGVSSRYYRAPYGVFAVADGYLCLSLNPLDRLARVFDDSALGQWQPEAEFDERDDINQLIADHMKSRTIAEWSAVFDEHGVWYATVNDYADVEADPQIAWNDSFVSFTHPSAGDVRVLGHPLRYGGQAPEVWRTPPALGQDTADVLTELGYPQQQIEKLADESVIRIA